MKIRSIAIAALLGFALAPAAWAQQQLRVSTYVPTQHWLVSQAMAQWAKEV
jgi:hypothetical protein